MSDQGMRCVRRQWENLTTFACSLLNYQGTQLLNGPNLKKRPIVQTIGNLPVVAGTMLAFAFDTLLLLLLSSCYMSVVVKSLQNVAVLCTRFCRRRRRCCCGGHRYCVIVVESLHNVVVLSIAPPIWYLKVRSASSSILLMAGWWHLTTARPGWSESWMLQTTIRFVHSDCLCAPITYTDFLGNKYGTVPKH